MAIIVLSSLMALHFGGVISTGTHISDNGVTDASELQSSALTARITAKQNKMRQDPFVEGWKVFVDCSMTCADEGGESLDCAHKCKDAMEPNMQAAIAAKAGLTSATPAPTTVQVACEGDDGCLWENCCKRYTAECLSCTVDMTVGEFCEVHENLNTPGCAASLLQELQKLRPAQR